MERPSSRSGGEGWGSNKRRLGKVCFHDHKVMLGFFCAEAAAAYHYNIARSNEPFSDGIHIAGVLELEGGPAIVTARCFVVGMKAAPAGIN